MIDLTHQFPQLIGGADTADTGGEVTPGVALQDGRGIDDAGDEQSMDDIGLNEGGQDNGQEGADTEEQDNAHFFLFDGIGRYPQV